MQDTSQLNVRKTACYGLLWIKNYLIQITKEDMHKYVNSIVLRLNLLELNINTPMI